MLYESGPVQNFIAFFICGLPGGLDYIMLILVKMDHMHAQTEKIINARINLWIRAPGLTVASVLIYIIVRYAPDGNACKSHPYLATLIGVVVFF